MLEFVKSTINTRSIHMENLQDKIAKRAYDLFVARGGQHGYHIQDWLQAEKDVVASASTKKAVKTPAKPKAAKAAKPAPAAAAPAAVEGKRKAGRPPSAKKQASKESAA